MFFFFWRKCFCSVKWVWACALHRVLYIEVLILGPIFPLFFGQMSIATDKKVQTVICFDRVARVLFGCSADEFFDFAKLHPFAGKSSLYL